MHDHSHNQPSQKGPCLQIMFNINSKNCVNNNIITDMNKPYHLDLNPNDGGSKNDKTVVMSNKKYHHSSNQKSNKMNLNKTTLNSSKPADFISQQNSKSNKKSFKTNKANISINQTQRSIKNANLQKNISGTFTKTNLNQQKNLISQRKSRKSKQNIEKNKIMRQKIIQLMIKDYQNGKISANNLKIAISSLIEKEANESKIKAKSYSKTQKSRIQLPNSYKSSLTNSFRNIPKNIPANSKSQKMYQHSFIKLGNKKNEQFDQQPEIFERVIDRKDFASKIIIKGINSSLFLSNQWTATNDSPNKKDSIINVNVINTSDSVKDLRRQMQKISTKTNEQKKINIDMNNYNNNSKKPKQSFLDQTHNQQTQNILDFYISQFQNHHNRKNQQFYQNFYSQKELTKMQMQSVEDSQQQLQEKIINIDDDVHLQSSSFGQYELRQMSSIINEQESHEQYEQQSLQQIKQPKIQVPKPKETQFFVNNVNNHPYVNKNNKQKYQSFQQESQILKSYVSSQIKNNQKKFTFSASKKQQLTEKRVKSITENEIKRLNQVLDVIKNQLNVQQKSQQKPKMNQQQVLSNLMLLIQKQRNKASQQLKLYQLFDDKRDFISRKERQENGLKIDHNQIINSFKKKINKKPFLIGQTTITNQQQKQITTNNNNNKVYFDSNNLRYQQNNQKNPLTSSFSSLSSQSSTNPLSRPKISQLNLDQIQSGLYKRLNDIQQKRQRQISIITQKFINDKISPKQYHEQKQIIQKWFLLQSNKLKKTRRCLQQGYKRVREVMLRSDNKVQAQINYDTRLTRQKSGKMIKCISERYLARRQQQSLSQKEEKYMIENNNQDRQCISLGKVKVQLNGDDGEYRNQYTTTLHETELEEEQQQQYQQQQQNYGGYQDDQDDDNEQQQEQYQEQQYQHQLQHQEQQYQQQQQMQQQIDIIHPLQTNAFTNEIISYLQQKYDEEQNYDHYVNDHSQQQQQHLQQHYQQQDLLLREQPQQNLNIIINKRPSSTSQTNYNNFKQQQYNNQQLFSPKKLPHHQQHQQFSSSSQLQQYNLLNNSSSQLQQQHHHHQQHQQSSSILSSLSLSFYQKANTHYFNPTNTLHNSKRLKHLADQDKDDIFQFIFLDLTLQILLDQSTNSKITKSIEKYFVHLKNKKSINRGFKTGLDTCKNYVNHIETYLLANYSQILKRLQSPIGPSAKQMLKFMRQYQDVSQQQSQTSSNDSVGLVLPIEVYEKFQLQPINVLKIQRYYDDDQRQTGRIKFLNSLKRFHTKALFDSLNQMLDLQRNFGIWGKPFPWKKTLSIGRKLTDTELKQKLKRSTQKVTQNCSYLCGVLLDKQDSVFGKSKISQQYLYHIRQDRMSKMLSNDVIFCYYFRQMLDNEQRWIFYDDQEVEVLMSLARGVISTIVYEAVCDVLVLMNRGLTG